MQILPRWNGRASWLWSQWKGTIFESTWPRALVCMGAATLLVVYTRCTAPAGELWSLWTMPDPDHPLVKRLKGLSGMWDLQLTLTTFVTTFFMSHAYAFWRKSYSLARSIQGRMNDLGLLVSTHAARDPTTGCFVPEARVVVQRALRRLSALHVFFWAAIVRRAPGSDHFGCSFNQVLSRRCLERLVPRGVITATERDALLGMRSNPRAWNLALLSWIVVDVTHAQQSGVLSGGHGFEGAVLEAATGLRRGMGEVRDEIIARMPMAYVHFVQVLVDVLCLMAPFALYPRCGSFTVLLSAIVCLFFGGLLEMCKVSTHGGACVWRALNVTTCAAVLASTPQYPRTTPPIPACLLCLFTRQTLLDPFGNRRVSNDNFRADVQIDVLIAESNAGLSFWPERVETLTSRECARADAPSSHATDSSRADDLVVSG